MVRSKGEIQVKFGTNNGRDTKIDEYSNKPSILLNHKRNALHYRLINGIFYNFVTGVF